MAAKRLVGEPAQPVAGGHRAHEDTLVGAVMDDAYAITQKRPAARLGGRIDGDHADALARLAPRHDQGGAQRGLADSRRSGDAHDMGARLAPRRVEQRLRRLAFGIALQLGERGGQRPLAALA